MKAFRPRSLTDRRRGRISMGNCSRWSCRNSTPPTSISTSPVSIPKNSTILLALPDEEKANEAPPLPTNPVSRLGDTLALRESSRAMRQLHQPRTMWRGSWATTNRFFSSLIHPMELSWTLNGVTAPALSAVRHSAEASYVKKRTEGYTETTISGDTRADWSEAFELVPSVQIAYVWHASVFTREVLDGLVRIGFLYPQQIIWNKGRTVLTRTHYWYQHEPCWYVRKKNAPWFGEAGENSTIWDSASPKFIMGGSDEEKYDHPTQKPVDLMRRPILNHLKRGGLRTLSRIGYHAGRGRIDGAGLLRNRGWSQVRGCHPPALADTEREESRDQGRRAHFRRDRGGTAKCAEIGDRR